MSAFAIILGVSFVAGSFIFTDTLEPGVRRHRQHRRRRRRPARSAEQRLRLGHHGQDRPGSARADARGRCQAPPAPTATSPTRRPSSSPRKGKLIGGGGPPGLGLTGTTRPPPRATRRPRSPRGTGPSARRGGARRRHRRARGLRVGDTVTLVTSGAQPRVTADARRARRVQGRPVGATLAFFDTKTAQQLYFDGKDQFTDGGCTAKDGTSRRGPGRGGAGPLPKRFEAVTGDAVAKEPGHRHQPGALLHQHLPARLRRDRPVRRLVPHHQHLLDPRRPAQPRARDAPGPRRGPRQVTRSVLFEAFVVGLVGSTVGLGLRASCSPSGSRRCSRLRPRPQRVAARLPAATALARMPWDRRHDGRGLPAGPPRRQDAAGGGDARRRRAARGDPAPARRGRLACCSSSGSAHLPRCLHDDDNCPTGWAAGCFGAS